MARNGQKRPHDFYGPNPLPQRKSVVVSILDVGTAKTTCIIARLKPEDHSYGQRYRTHGVEVLGFGHHRSHGIKSGYVIDLERAEQGIRHAVHQAERMANLTLDTIIVSLTAGRIGSDVLAASVALAGHAVSERDIARVLKAGSEHAIAPARSILHSMPIGFALDGDRGIADPRGMFGAQLGVDMHVVTADIGPLRNLEQAINAAHLEVEGYVTAAHASGLSVLVDDEMDLGTVCLDIGAGTTSIGVFYDGEFVHADVVPLGGHHITMDLARGLSTRIDEAERLKTLHGSSLPSPADDRDMLTIPPVSDEGHEGGQQVPRGALTRIIRPRLEEILELTRDRLSASGFAGLAAKRLVVTGGGSQMSGLAELSRRILSRNVRLGRPIGVSGLPEAATGPAFAAACGLLIYPQRVRIASREHAGSQTFAANYSAGRATGTGGYFQKVSQWLKSSL
ncbi:cell division protein FtsA [Synechococcus sp. BA-124 BA4]|uniref:cell division protein FtsA n=1 Tax=Synechococcus sp. BA-124 BA4 TaxID=3110251 RepID=UPI002B205A5E|nr:cell division protein FtsA [Synechococcus sp. BA-124 BA4]MEA5399331.1 cell division protein FtsA [Synechococcus sp. BA-124 BA4]